MNYPTHWKIFTTPAVNADDLEKLKHLFSDWPTVDFKQKDQPVPMLICYNCDGDATQEVADRLYDFGYDVIAVQSDSGPIP